MEVLLVHSPLVGPTTWHWVADALTEAGHDVVVPDLRSSAVTGQTRAFIDAIVAATPSHWSAPVIVAHSGAGFFAPSVAGRFDVARSVFVDAGLPPGDGRATPAADFLDRLRAMAVDGTLPRWSTWWADGVLETLVPDDDRRRQIEAELPEVPLSFYESPVELPTGWSAMGGSYLLLSEAYRAHAERPRTLGWPVIERLGGHLDLVNEPEAIAGAIVALTR